MRRLRGRIGVYARFVQLYRRHVRRLALEESDEAWHDTPASRGGGEIAGAIRSLPLELREALLLVALADFRTPRRPRRSISRPPDLWSGSAARGSGSPRRWARAEIRRKSRRGEGRRTSGHQMTDRSVLADAHAYVDNCLHADARRAFEARLRDPRCGAV